MAKKEQLFETIIGFLVIFCAVGFLAFGLTITNTKTTSKYSLEAKFDNVEGILVGSDVKISGIKVGIVTDQHIDTETYSAVLQISIDKNIKIPRDSVAKVSTSGLIGSKFLEIQPGADEKYLKENEKLRYTQSTINLEDLISRFVFKNDKGDRDDK